MVDATFDRLTSGRLVLRRFRADDIAAFVRYRADPEVARFQSWENFSTEDGERFYAWVRTQHPDTPGEWFQVAVALRESDAIIGDCGLHALAEPADEVEIGFTLAPEHQGRGYASEAVACLLDYVFGRLGKSRAAAITDVRNARSIAVLERLGFMRDPVPRGPVLFKGELCDEYCYRLSREDWLRKTKAGQRYPCPCCGYMMFEEPPGSSAICKICFWEDDFVQLLSPDLAGGANMVSLIEAQRNYAAIGAMEERFKQHVRAAGPDDVRDPLWRPLDPALDRLEQIDRIHSNPKVRDVTSFYYWRNRPE